MTIQPGTILIRVTCPHIGQRVVISAYGRYRSGVIMKIGPRFAVVDCQIGNDWKKLQIKLDYLYMISGGSKEQQLEMGAMRVYDTMSRLPYDKKRRGPDRLVPIQI